MSQQIKYGITDTPPWYLCIFLGFQHYLSIFIASLTIPLLIAQSTCMQEDNVGKSELIGTLIFVGGIITIFQVVFGSRLPIIQAGTYALMSPTLSYLSLPKWECPLIVPNTTAGMFNSSVIIEGSPEHKEIWQSRIREIQGGIMVASCFEILLGASGAIGFLLNYIGPLTICPTIALIGLSLFKSAANYASGQWWITIMTILLLIIFSQYCANVKVPCPGYSKRKGCFKVGYPFFKLFPVILSIMVAWLICYILTVTNVFPNDPKGWGYMARTDVRLEVLQKAPWIKVPYPGQWGLPRVDIALVCGLLAGILSTTIESVGDYNACAKLCGAPLPPTHAVNRGICVEGIGCCVAGAFGSGNGTTSSSVNIGVIGLSGVGSRVVVLVAAGFMIFFGMLNKFGALFLTVPDPIIGAIFIVLFGTIVAVGISSLQSVDLNSSRNLFVFGFSFFVGLCLPEWIRSNSGAINTGSDIGDNVLTVLCSTHNVVGGVIAFILDNTIPGTPQERGLKRAVDQDNLSGSMEENLNEQKEIEKIYDLPFCMGALSRNTWTKYIPFCPTFLKSSKVDKEREMDVRNVDLKNDINENEENNSKGFSNGGFIGDSDTLTKL